MVWFVKKHALATFRRFLRSAFIISLILFVFFAYSLYAYELVLTSPGGTGYAVGNFLLWAFIIGMIVTLIIISVIIYIFLHDSEHEN